MYCCEVAAQGGVCCCVEDKLREEVKRLRKEIEVELEWVTKLANEYRTKSDPDAVWLCGLHQHVMMSRGQPVELVER